MYRRVRDGDRIPKRLKQVRLHERGALRGVLGERAEVSAHALPVDVSQQRLQLIPQLTTC